MHKRRKALLVSFASAAIGCATAITAAIVLAVVDLGRQGHLRESLNRSWIAIPEWGMFMSRADVMMLSCGVFASVVSAWLLWSILKGR